MTPKTFFYAVIVACGLTLSLHSASAGWYCDARRAEIKEYQTLALTKADALELQKAAEQLCETGKMDRQEAIDLVIATYRFGTYGRVGSR